MKKLLVALVVVVVLAGGAIYWFVIRDDAPAELSLSDPPSTAAGGEAGPVDVDGTWKVQQSEATTAGLRITEKFAGGAASHVAVGRTTEVTGSLTVAATKVPTASFTVDMTSIEFTDSPPGLDVANRSRAMQNAGLQTSTFPRATFALTSPIDLGTTPTAGKEITAKATGDLTLHGVTKSVSFEVTARVTGDILEVVSTDPVPVALADYDIEPPVLGPVADVADEGSFEFKLSLAKA